MEQRNSPRTRTSLPVTARRGDVILQARCVELSQTGMLLRAPRALHAHAWPYLSAKLLLPSGPVTVLCRRVGVRADKVAYAFQVLDAVSQQRLTDHLFDCLHAEAQKRSRRVCGPSLRRAS